MALNRRNIYLRDRYECAFCLTRLRSVDLSLDHVHPRCKGGKSTWDNLVSLPSAYVCVGGLEWWAVMCFVSYSRVSSPSYTQTSICR